MITFTEKHISAITDLANKIEFQGWRITERQSMGKKIDPNLPLASLGKETHHGYAGQTELEYYKEEIDLYADGTIAAINEEINGDGEYAEYSSLTLSQLRVLLTAAEKIASATAESESNTMDGPTRDDRILLTMHAEAKNQRFAALPLGARQWEIRDIVEGKTYVLGGSIQRAICECVANILNQATNNNNE